VLEVVDELDLAAFSGAHRQAGHGRAAHDPAMMVVPGRSRAGVCVAGWRSAGVRL
jgi:hypothetical protein